MYIYIYIYTRSQARAKARAFVLAVLRMAGLERKKSFDGGVDGSLQMLHRFGAERYGFRCPNRATKVPRTMEMDPKRDPGTFKDTAAEQGRTNIENGSQKYGKGRATPS